MYDITGQYWATLIAVTVFLGFYTAVAWRAFFFNPPVTLGLGSILAAAALVATFSSSIAIGLAAIGVLAFIGWHVYYVYRDWQSRPLRWLVAGLVASLAAINVLLFTR